MRALTKAHAHRKGDETCSAGPAQVRFMQLAGLRSIVNEKRWNFFGREEGDDDVGGGGLLI